MSENFSINTNFQTQKFDNIIKDFDKAFSNQINNNFDGSGFENVLEEVVNKNKNSTEDYNIKSDVTPVEKLAFDIQNGFSNSIQELNSAQIKAERDFETFAAGGDISVHEVMISAEKSNLAMQMAIQLRNQFLNAYNEFKNMSV